LEVALPEYNIVSQLVGCFIIDIRVCISSYVAGNFFSDSVACQIGIWTEPSSCPETTPFWVIYMNLFSAASSSDENLKRIQGRFSPFSIFLITILGIAMAEVIAMIVIYFFRDWPYYQQIFLDAAIMTVIIFPWLYGRSFRPLLQHIQQRYQVERIIATRLQIVNYANTHTLDELLQFTIDEIETLTGSTVGFFHFLELDQKTLHLKTWSTNTVQNVCSIKDANAHYPVDQAGVWADCVRLKRPVIHNNYAALPNRKGLPDGHAPIIREMAVPIIRDEKIVAILGVGNKLHDFTAYDVELASTLADFAWDMVQQKQASDALKQSEERFRTLVNWTYDWELWVDPSTNIVYCSPSCKRITGYGPEEFIDDTELLREIVHAEDRDFFQDHHESVHDASIGMDKIEYRIIDRNGAEHWIEHICRPLFGEAHQYLGRRISNRDITERKLAERNLEEQNRKEQLLTQTIHSLQLDIARDLHDTIGQNISFLRMKLDFLAGKKTIKKTDLQSEISSMTKAASESYDLLRGTLAVLQAGESAQLSHIFARYARQIEDRSLFNVELITAGEPRPLSSKKVRQLFYVFREALNNIEKHAQANLVSIQILWNSDRFTFKVLDDGIGFDLTESHPDGHFGLKFMRQRLEMLNGSLDIQSELGSGTSLVIQVPYE
jgi:PAS domain S-box-containing protein